jgi:hypothetical protein
LKRFLSIGAVKAVTFVLGLACGAGAQAGLVNGGFEAPMGVPTGGFRIIPVAEIPGVPGWKATGDGAIELWDSGFLGVTAFEGRQFAEINANEVAALYQEVSGISAGSVVGFQFAHRAREGTDVMRLTITDFGLDGTFGNTDDTVLFTSRYSDTTAAWGFYTNPYPIVALGHTVRFSYQAISTGSGNDSVGNFLDAADFGVGVGRVPEPATLALLGLGLAGIGFSRRKQ